LPLAVTSRRDSRPSASLRPSMVETAAGCLVLTSSEGRSLRRTLRPSPARRSTRRADAAASVFSAMFVTLVVVGRLEAQQSWWRPEPSAASVLYAIALAKPAFEKGPPKLPSQSSKRRSSVRACRPGGTWLPMTVTSGVAASQTTLPPESSAARASGGRKIPAA
jgi:hypothetical protein